MPLLWISIAFIAGLILGERLPGSGINWLACAAICLLLWPILRRLPDRGLIFSHLRWMGRAEPHLFVPPLLLLAMVAFGVARMAYSGPDLQNGHVAALNDQGKFRLVAVVSAPPDRRDRSTLLRLKVEAVATLDESGKPGDNAPAHGEILALLAGRVDYDYGDRLSLEGQPVTPPENEDFSYRAYLARQGVYTYLAYPLTKRLNQNAGSPFMAAIYRIRDWGYREVNHLFPAPEGPLLAGILLGIDSDLPDTLTRAFQDTGTAHVIAISGFNIAILAELFSKLFGKIFSRWWAMLVSIGVIIAYTVMVGATASVVRAAIMGSLALVGQQIGRRTAGGNTLAFTAMLMCLPNPHLPWDPSFQLSFGATLGLILYGDRLQTGFTNLLKRRFSSAMAAKIAGPVGEYVLMTLAAQLLTLPVILYHFQRLSLSSLLANPLILPPQPLVMVLSGVAVLAGAISDPLAHALAWLAWPLSAYTNRMVEALGSIPNGVLALSEFNLTSVALMYAAVIAPLISPRLPGELKKAVTPTLVLTTLALVAALVWRGAALAPDGRLRVIVYEINDSQTVLLRGPGGETLLINGGPSSRLLNDALDRWLSPLDRRVDGLLLNTAQASLLNGLPGALETHPLQRAWWGLPAPDSRVSQDINDLLRSQQVETGALVTGDTLTLGEARLTVLASGSQGSALLLTWQNFRALIPSGVPIRQLPPDSLANLSLLVLDPRDLKTDPPDAWLALAPRAIVATPGASAVQPGGLNWLNTHPEGWYAAITDGKQLWLEMK